MFVIDFFRATSDIPRSSQPSLFQSQADIGHRPIYSVTSRLRTIAGLANSGPGYPPLGGCSSGLDTDIDKLTRRALWKLSSRII